MIIVNEDIGSLQVFMRDIELVQVMERSEQLAEERNNIGMGPWKGKVGSRMRVDGEEDVTASAESCADSRPTILFDDSFQPSYSRYLCPVQTLEEDNFLMRLDGVHHLVMSYCSARIPVKSREDLAGCFVPCHRMFCHPNMS